LAYCQPISFYLVNFYTLYTIKQIAAAGNFTILGNAIHDVKYLSVDSRKISFPAQTLFFAIKTGSRNGHLFIKDVYDQGVRSFVVSEEIDCTIYADAVFLQVDNTSTALQQIAAFHRRQFSIPVIGITGSNGKTIVKEWLNQLLQDDYAVARSPKSYNSQIGVPLSVWQLNKSHTLGIFEAGISKPNEMSNLQKVIQPTIGLLTNIGAAHDEGFVDRKEKLQEKLMLFDHVKVLIYCADNLLVQEEVAKMSVDKFSWGKSADNHLQVLLIEKHKSFTNLLLKSGDVEWTVQIFFTDDASIENVLHCIAIGKYLGISNDILSERVQAFHPIEMRLEWKKAISNCYLLNDSYSNDLSSFIITLDYLQQQQQNSKQTVILSDFFESGLDDDDLYGNVAALLQQRKIERLIIVGSHISFYKNIFETAGIIVRDYKTTEELIADFEHLSFANESILLKGARKFGFERIALLLEQKVHQTVLEINLTALAHNLQQYRQLLQPSTKIMVMVKAFGYGSGDAEVARLLQFNKVDYLAVAYTDEGVALRKAGIHLPIMVMNPEIAGFDTLESYNLEPELYSFEILQAFENYCKQQGISQYPVHIKLDTGMHRLGFEMNEVEALATWLAAQNTLVVKSIFTHLVASENPSHDEFTNQQASHFANACSIIEAAIGYSFIKHAANTSGIRRHPKLHFDMVRLGIGLYGVESSGMHVMPVSTLKSTVAQTRIVKAGETVGYGRMGKVERDSIIATVRIGYADGFRRQLGNGVGQMYVNGKPAPTVGNVCMDMTMVDVTDIAGTKAGDTVEIFGTQIPVQQLAQKCATISYEIMTSIGQRVKRVYVQE
jgi:alanine racemase